MSDIKNDCVGNACSPSRKGDADSASTLATLSDVGFVLGLVGIGVGVYGLVSQPSSPSSASVQLRLGPGSVGVDGRF